MAAFIYTYIACGFCRLVKLSLHWHRFNPLRNPYCVLCTITNPKTLHKFFPFPLPPFRHTGHVCWCRKMFAQHISIYEHHNTLSSCHRFFFLSETDISKQFLPLNTARHKPHSFPHYKSNVIMLKNREKESCNIYFWWHWKRICKDSQYLAFATLHK